MKLRKLKESGIQKMSEFLDSLNSENPKQYPENILTEPAYSDSLGTDAEVELREFKSKFEIADYFYQLFKTAGMKGVIEDTGLWCWLSLFYFKALCPKTRGGKYNPGARARWIPEVSNFQRYYRHLLAGPYRIYDCHNDKPDRARALLCGSIYKQGELVEQIASRKELITNKSFIQAITKLYYEPEKETNKKGSGGKGAGSPRRLADVTDQFNLTWDLYAMTSEEILNLLPAEFDRFKS